MSLAVTETRPTDEITSALASAIASRQVLRYAGYCYDSLTGLYYLSQRYYDPATFQFLSKDPIRGDGEESAYQYCGGNPISRTDPSGLSYLLRATVRKTYDGKIWLSLFKSDYWKITVTVTLEVLNGACTSCHDMRSYPHVSVLTTSVKVSDGAPKTIRLRYWRRVFTTHNWSSWGDRWVDISKTGTLPGTPKGGLRYEHRTNIIREAKFQVDDRKAVVV
ncbi:MAG: RHS repeat-associated core domain-containing protein, partial [Coriobacteriia bacterium]|nr:RHS repeat-associated core domain-containing protein [Coriobacteriia bacterium]